MRRVVESRNFLSFVLSTAIGVYLFRAWPFPAANNVLQMVLLEDPYLFYGTKYAFTAMLFTTPYIMLSVLFSCAYIFIVRQDQKISLAQLSLYPDPAMRKELFLAIGEIHSPTRPEPSPNPQWLVVPERGLFTGIAIFGAIGSGRTSDCIYPFAEQLLAYRAGDAERRVAGLVLEVKGDFCQNCEAF